MSSGPLFIISDTIISFGVIYYVSACISARVSAIVRVVQAIDHTGGHENHDGSHPNNHQPDVNKVS